MHLTYRLTKEFDFNDSAVPANNAKRKFLKSIPSAYRNYAHKVTVMVNSSYIIGLQANNSFG